MKTRKVSPIFSLLFIIFAFLFATGFTSKKVELKAENSKQQLRSALLKIDKVLQLCIDQTIAFEPTSLEAGRAVALREKIFFALEHRPFGDSEKMQSVLLEVKQADGKLGSACSNSLAKLNLKKRVRESSVRN